MYHPEILYRIGQLRHRELLLQAERERLVLFAPKNRPGYRTFGSKFIAWVRGWLPEKFKREGPLFERNHIYGPCCTAPESQLG
jgi:hypothetical protein